MKQVTQCVIFALTILYVFSSNISAADSSLKDLENEEIKKLFSLISEVYWPVARNYSEQEDWSLTFLKNGTWDGNLTDIQADGYGKWYVKDHKICLTLDGGRTDWSEPAKGCLGVSVNLAEKFVYLSGHAVGSTPFKLVQIPENFKIPSTGFASNKTQAQTDARAAVATNRDIKVKGFNNREIKDIFSGLSSVQWPSDEPGKNAVYLFNFSDTGSWEGDLSDGRFGVWGKWKAKDGKLCVTMDGGETDWVSPFVGCVPIKVDKEATRLIADFLPVDKQAYILTDDISGLQVVLGSGKKEKISKKKETNIAAYVKGHGFSGSWINRNNIKELFYKTEGGEIKRYKITDITDTKISFEYTEWLGNFAETGMRPYSPGHFNVETTVVDKIPENFLDRMEGARLTYKVQEEWNSDYGMLWELKAEITKTGLLNYKNANIEVISLDIFGESIEENGFNSSSWAEVGIKFEETLIIDKRSKLLIERKRSWKSRTTNSPESENQLFMLDKIVYRDGTVITWNQITAWAKEEAENRSVLAKKKAEKARKLKIALKQKEDKRKKLLEEETKLRILSVQRSLRTLGVYQGEVNGVLSSNLLSSLTQWGKGSGFLFKGDITPALVSILELTAEDEKVAKAKALEKKKKEEIARKKAEKKRKAKLARKKKAEKKRKAELARKKEMEKKRKAELARKKEVEKKRKAELARKKEVEKKRKAELARIKEEKKRNIELYEENIGKANYTIEVVRKFLKENPRTSVLADASIALLGVRKSIKEKNGQELVKKITILNNTLNKDRQYKKYVSKVTALKLTNLKKVLSTYNLVLRDVLLERIEAGSENVEQVAANIKIVSEGLNSKKLSEVINNVKTVESFINADKEMTVKLKLTRKKAEDAHKAKLAREEADKQRKAKLASQKAEKALKEKLAREEADKQRKAELARRKAEESRREELARKEHEEKRKAEQALKAQKAEVAREAELAKQEKIRRIAEQARIDAEKQRAERLALKKAEDARIAEETRLAELARKKAEEARLKEQARREAAEALALKKRNEQRKLYKNKILFKIAEKNNMVKLLDHNSETSSLVIGCSYNLQINNYTGSDISVKRLQLHSSLRGVSNLGSAGSWISINKKIGNDGVETDIPPILLGKRIEVLKKLDEDSKEIKQYKDKYACEKQDGTISIKYKKPATFLKIANKKRLSRKTLSRILVGTDVSGNQIKIVQQ